MGGWPGWDLEDMGFRGLGLGVRIWLEGGCMGFRLGSCEVGEGMELGDVFSQMELG